MKALRFLSISAALAAAPAWGAAPVIDEPVPLNGDALPSQVAPKVKVGKVLLFPITASDADGDTLSYKVSSSNGKVLVRARTGQTRLKMNVTHAAGAEGDPAFEGTLDFLLFRDITPMTSAHIAGFSQSPYYTDTIFHRIANLALAPERSFIVQGGDPDGTGTGGPGFIFDNEFDPSAIFVGRGQLAMANSGINSTTFRGSNGSQFFITEGQPRHLDYNHTIFGQLMRGWETFEKMTAVPRHPAPDPEDEDAPPQDKPIVDLKLATTSVEPNRTDAMLVISATAPGSSIITVEVSDGSSEPVMKTFTVTAEPDTDNTPPYIRPIPNRSIAKNKILNVPIKTVDLENDFLFYSNRVLAPTSGQSSGSGNPARVVGNLNYAGPLNLGVGVTQYDMTGTGTGAADDQVAVAIAVGDKKIVTRIESFSATPGVPVSDFVVASYTDADPRSRNTSFVAKINWGDGTALTDGVIGRDPSKASPTAFAIRGTHTYQNPGVYPVVIYMTSTGGQRATLRAQAVVTAGPLRAFGETIQVTKPKFNDGVVATFKDDAPAAPSAYTAEIMWGDGATSAGTVRRARSGDYQVLGTHRFVDPENHAVTVRIRKSGGAEAFAWSLAEVSGFTGKPHLPPFAAANLIGQISQTAVPGSNPPIAVPVTQTVGNQTFASVELIVLNGGTRDSKPGKVRFYLSADSELNLQDETIPNPTKPEEMLINPRDRQITIGAEFNASLDIQALAPGGGVRFVLAMQDSDDARLRFPAGDKGGGMNILARLDYSDPLTDNLPVDRNVLYGPFDPFVVKPASLVVQELGEEGSSTVKPESAKFSVKLAHQPASDVSINITLTTANKAQVELEPALLEPVEEGDPDLPELVFTPENWDTAQEITVKAKDDGSADGTKFVVVTLGSASSTDLRYRNRKPSNVTVTVLDKVVPTP